MITFYECGVFLYSQLQGMQLYLPVWPAAELLWCVCAFGGGWGGERGRKRVSFSVSINNLLFRLMKEEFLFVSTLYDI